MPTSLSFSVIIAFTFFYGFVNTHERHSSQFQGASQTYLMALNLSVIAGIIIGLGLLIFYGIQTAWYWPIVLFIVGNILSGVLFALLDNIVGIFLSPLGFVGWPIFAYWFYRIISGL
jgi:hypothetical protein